MWFKQVKQSETKVEPHLVRYTVHPIRCEVCGMPLKNGDLLFSFETMRDDKRISSEIVMAHADCMVQHPDSQGMISRRPHEKSIVLSKEQWEAWKKEAEG